jgi:hypothetical protein
VACNCVRFPVSQRSPALGSTTSSDGSGQACTFSSALTCVALCTGRLMIVFVLYDVCANPTFREYCLGPLYDWYASSTEYRPCLSAVIRGFGWSSAFSCRDVPSTAGAARSCFLVRAASPKELDWSIRLVAWG